MKDIIQQILIDGLVEYLGEDGCHEGYGRKLAEYMAEGITPTLLAALKAEDGS